MKPRSPARWLSGSIMLIGLVLAAWWSLTTNLEGINFFLFPMACVLLVAGAIGFFLT